LRIDRQRKELPDEIQIADSNLDLFFLMFLLLPLQGLRAPQDKVAARKQSLGAKQKRLQQEAAIGKEFGLPL
jgi:hypothetical protein